MYDGAVKVVDMIGGRWGGGVIIIRDKITFDYT